LKGREGLGSSLPPAGQARVQCLTLAKPDTDCTPDAQTQRPVPPWPASGARDFSKFPTGAIENMHFIFSKSTYFGAF